MIVNSLAVTDAVPLAEATVAISDLLTTHSKRCNCLLRPEMGARQEGDEAFAIYLECKQQSALVLADALFAGELTAWARLAAGEAPVDQLAFREGYVEEFTTAHMGNFTRQLDQPIDDALVGAKLWIKRAEWNAYLAALISNEHPPEATSPRRGRPNQIEAALTLHDERVSEGIALEGISEGRAIHSELEGRGENPPSAVTIRDAITRQKTPLNCR
jgi:hypothetical protein